MPVLAAEILANPEKYKGMTIPVNSGYITPADCEKALTKVTGKTIRYGIMQIVHISEGFPCIAAARISSFFEVNGI